MDPTNNFQAFEAVHNYYKKQSRSYNGVLRKIMTRFRHASQDQLKILNIVDKPFINVRRLKTIFFSITRHSMPRIIVHNIFKDHFLFTFAYSIQPDPWDTPKVMTTDNPILHLFLVCYQLLTHPNEEYNTTGLKLRNIKNSDYVSPVIKSTYYTHKTTFGAKYQGMDSETSTTKNAFYQLTGLVGKKLTIHEFGRLHLKATKQMVTCIKKRFYESFSVSQKIDFNKYYQLLFTDHLVPFQKFLLHSHIPVEKQSKVVSGISRVEQLKIKIMQDKTKSMNDCLKFSRGEIQNHW